MSSTLEITPALSDSTAAARPVNQRRRNRLIALALLLPMISVLGVAYALTPASRGVGTHQQLGLRPCEFLAVTGLPCATCGMTTAVSYAAHGRIDRALVTQPAGALLSLVIAALAIIAAYALVTGVSLAPVGRVIGRPKAVIFALLVVLLAWGYNIAAHTLPAIGD